MLAPDISILLTAHSEGRLAHPTVGSVKAAIEACADKGLNCEWIIVLDRPTQDMLDYFESFPPPVAHTERTDFGDPGLARNKGISFTRGKYLAVIDGDDLWSANWLVEAHSFMESFSKPCVAHSEVKVCFERKHFIAPNVDQESADFHREGLFEKNYWNPSCFALRQTFTDHPYAKSDLRNGIGYEDWYWNLEVMESGLLHKVVPNTIHAIRFKSWKASQLAQSASLECVLMRSRFWNLAYQKEACSKS